MTPDISLHRFPPEKKDLFFPEEDLTRLPKEDFIV